MIDQDTIFLLGQDKRLERIPHRLYVSEDLLQELIDQYPELLVGEQIDPDDPPRWLMVQREAGIPDSKGGYDRWSIDHVLLDQHGRPTLIEVKRSTDTRIRREVVGQMLDYAANALKYWPKDRIRELAASQYGGLEALEARIRDLLDRQETDIEEFWQAVDRNLREGELRLLFVADQIPTELRRIIEFLNENMPRVEVLGVEIRQYERDGNRVLVPRVVGQTESARQAKSRPAKRDWTLEEAIAGFTDRGPINARAVVRRIVDWAESDQSIIIETGSGSTYPSIRVRIRTEKSPITFITLWPNQEGALGATLYFGALKAGVAPFAHDEPREGIAMEIRNRIDSTFNPDRFEKYPSFNVSTPEALDALIVLMDKIVATARSA